MRTKIIATLAAATMLLSLGLSAFAAGPMTPAAPNAAPGHPVLDVAVNPGDVLLNGDYIVSGMAYDPAATDGAGISKVDFFLGDRDAGGVYLGSAMPGTMDGFTAGSWLAQTAFQTKITLPAGLIAARDFCVYAQSSVTGLETEVDIPIYVGAAPTPTPRPSTSNPNPVPPEEG